MLFRYPEVKFLNEYLENNSLNLDQLLVTKIMCEAVNHIDGLFKEEKIILRSKNLQETLEQTPIIAMAKHRPPTIL
jgi:hypothetical protein